MTQIFYSKSMALWSCRQIHYIWKERNVLAKNFCFTFSSFYLKYRQTLWGFSLFLSDFKSNQMTYNSYQFMIFFCKIDTQLKKFIHLSRFWVSQNQNLFASKMTFPYISNKIFENLKIVFDFQNQIKLFVTAIKLDWILI